MKRLGGELPLYVDRIGLSQPWQSNWLAFSNGRAALAWLFDRCGITSVAICAYTCPTLTAFLRRRGLATRFYDVGEDFLDLPGAGAIVAPVLFGSPPWRDCSASRTLIVVDAAQTAFGHIDFVVSEHGAIVSCPRKCTELADGAILAVSSDLLPKHPDVEALPVANDAAAFKMLARANWAIGSEQEAVMNNEIAEGEWPETPHRMSDPSRAMLERLDREWHKKIRRSNRDILASEFLGRIQFWSQGSVPFAEGTPFSLPIFVGNRDELLAALKAQRIFATALWPDAEHDPEKHPNAAWMAKHLVSLPVDQRHDADDMRRVAEAVLAVAKPPPDPPQGMLGFIA